MGAASLPGGAFVNINAGGEVEPCPASPFSDVNVATMSLKEALQSDLLKTIRQQHGSLTETAGGCALWTEREWVRSLLPLSKSVAMRVSPSSEHESKS